MPPKSKKTARGETPKFNGVVAVKKIWRALTPGQWNALLTSIAPQYHWQLKGTTISATCPYHTESNPSFKLQPTRGFGKCFGACGKHVHDIVELIRHLKKCSYTEALLLLVNEYKLGGVIGQDSDELAKYHQLQEMKKQAAIAFNEVIVEFLRDSPPHLSYLVPGVTYLLNGRNLDPNVIHTLPVGLFAKPEHVKKHFKVPGLEALYDEYFGAKDGSFNPMANWGKVIFHYNDSTGSISQFKCRDFQDKTTLEGIFNGKHWKDIDPVTAREICAHSFTYIADPYAAGRGIFGLHKYSRIAGRDSAEAYVTEGEFDALSVMNAQEQLGRQDFMMLATGGNANDITFLTDSDIKYIWLVPDHPSKKGDEFAANLLKHVGEKIRKNNLDLKFKIFQWPPALAGADLDEAIQLNGYEYAYAYLHVNRNDYFLNSTPWVIKQCEAVVRAIGAKLKADLAKLEIGDSTYDVAKSNLEDNANALNHEALLKWVDCLPEPTEKAAFARRFDELCGIDITKSSDVHVSMFALDTYEGCIQALRTSINDMFAMAYYEIKSNGNVVTLWSKERFEAIPVKEAILDTIIAQYGNSDLLSWARSILKDAPYITIENNDIASMRKLTGDIKFLTNTAINGLVHTARPLQSLNKVGQGIHYEWLPGSAKVNGYIYFVNGTKVFRGKFDQETGKLNWEFINNIVDNDIIFKLNIQDKWSYVDDVTDLYEAVNVNLNAVFDKLLKVIDGWKFENHEFMREYLAAWIMSIPCQRACGKINMTYVTGESNSGKTSLARGLLGGGGSGSSYEVPCLLEPAIFRSDATAAGMYQEMDASGLMFTIDEAESSEAHNTEHDNRIKEIQRMCFSIATGGHSISRGGSTPDQRQSYNLQNPILMCGININNDPVFLSRVMTVYTQKELQRQNIGDYLDMHFTREELEILKRNITIGMLPHLQELRRAQIDLQRDLPDVKVATATTGRFNDTIMPALSVYKLLGKDPTAMYQNIVEAYKYRLEAVTQGSTKMELIHTVLYTKSIRSNGEDSYNLQDPRTLIMNGEINYLNNSSIGVYYYQDMHWIIIVWRQVKHSFLRNTPYYTQDEATLSEACSKSAFVINDITPAQHKAITRSFRLGDIKNKAGYTVLSATYIVNFDDDDDAPAAKPGKAEAEECIEAEVVAATSASTEVAAIVEEELVQPTVATKPKVARGIVIDSGASSDEEFVI